MSAPDRAGIEGPWGPRVGAVVLNHDDAVNARRLVRALCGCAEVSRVAVVDNSGAASLRGDEEELLDGKVRFLRCANDGYARGNNRGAALLRQSGGCDYYLFSNTDIRVGAGGIERCVDFLERHADFAVAAPRMLRPDGSPHHLSAWRERGFLCDLAYSSGLLSRTVGMYRETYPPEYFSGSYAEVDCVSGSFFLVRSKVFDEMGGFDGRTFLFYEEDILGFRLKRMGLKEAVLTTCSFVHEEGISAGRRVNYLRKYLIMQRSRLYFHRVYTRLSPLKYAALCAATGLGAAENAVKTLVGRLRG